MKMKRILRIMRPTVSIVLAIAMGMATVGSVLAAPTAQCEPEPVMKCEMASSSCCCPEDAAVPEEANAFEAPTCDCELSKSTAPAIPPRSATWSHVDITGDPILETSELRSTAVASRPGERYWREGPPGSC